MGGSTLQRTPATHGGTAADPATRRGTAADGTGGTRRPPAALVLGAALLGFFVIGLDASAVNVALPAMGRSLGGATTGLQWVVDAYTLMFAALLLSAGALSDRLGANRVFAAGLAVFTAASAACGLAPSLSLLIGARIVQGTAAAVMLPSSLALVRQAYPQAAERARAIALWTVGGAVSTAAGPVVGGALTSSLGWPSIFFLNLPVGLVTLLVLARVPASPRRHAALDLPGQLAAVVALAALTYGVIEGGGAGFGSPQVIGSLALAVLAMAAFVAVEAKVADPMVPLSLFRSRTVGVSLLIGFAVNAAFYGTVFVVGLFFQQVLGLSAVGAGVMFVPMTALVALANVGSARAAARFGPRVPIAIGQLVCAAGLFSLLAVDAHTPRLLTALLLVPMGVGLGFAVPSLTAAMLGDVPAERAGLAGGVLNAGRQTGGALAVAAFGALVAQRATFVHGMHLSVLVSAVLLVATAGAALALPRSRRA
ncbi:MULTISPECIES: MFS transporter [Streptomycetaceae]|uniref:Major facilitator superfamily MFS_1 n=1 Tax=Streptantibioticus cattleyicolor (strain ATCC 35852 / DSM 46488 / JCM 4925 / NBRC 14057 / NRRL 8057) TaxID=1003195 RepID=F8JTL2_STREN|nr:MULTISPECIES: MFS transporter [Streptomycetaceae]AEW95583.1 major facilitator superfamily MFS_1 [Streptantibioticus cattleyicolor NRRL 8057 = DSM 46488]MYS60133.1 MFS transporter [Streptomyces sp. SID5468]CCB75919.1 Arabinose efflux permease family protein [Streptantibioticus cattleyicolor NRRL 8057 = DSM 46488]